MCEKSQSEVGSPYLPFGWSQYNMNTTATMFRLSPRTFMKKVTIVMISSTLLLASLTTFPRIVAAQNPAPQQSSPQSGGTLIWGTINTPTIINPVLTSHSVSMSLIGLVFNRLVRINSKGQIEPDLAESWTISDDGLEYVFYLRENVFFHDGKPFTAEDVAFTYRQIMNPDNDSPFRAHFRKVHDITIADPYTITFTLNEPSKNFLYELEREIIPKHLFKSDISAEHPFNYAPIGTGPFRFVSWDRDTNEIQLVRHEHYFERPALLEGIVIKVFLDMAQMLSAFLRGEIDLIKFVNAGDVELISEDSSFDVFAVNSGTYYALVYDLSSSLLGAPETRKSIARAINVKEIVARTYEGNGVVSTGPFHSDSIGFNRHVEPITYNPVRSKLDFMHRGWRDGNEDGILEKDRQRLDLVIFVDRRKPIERRIVKVIRQQLSTIGINVIVSLYDNEDGFIDKVKSETRPRAWLRHFFGIELDQDNYAATMQWYSQSTEFAKWGNYKNLEVDARFEKIKLATTEEERRRLYQEIHRIIYDDQPACFLFYPVSYHAISSQFQNAENYFTTYMPIYTLKDWTAVKTP